MGELEGLGGGVLDVVTLVTIDVVVMVAMEAVEIVAVVRRVGCVEFRTGVAAGVAEVDASAWAVVDSFLASVVLELESRASSLQDTTAKRARTSTVAQRFISNATVRYSSLVKITVIDRILRI